MSHEHDDIDTNNSSNPTFESVLAKRVTRRDMLSGAGSAAALAVVGSTAAGTALAHGNGDGGYGGYPQRTLKLNFDPVAKNLEDVVTVPRGYSVDVLYALGDPIAKASRTTATMAPTTRRALRCAPAIITTACITSASATTGNTTSTCPIAGCCV